MADTATELETLIADARRYRKLRAIACPKLGGGALEAAVAMAQLDFVHDAEQFDRTVDALSVSDG